jgi:hypothetical protein
VNPEHDPRPREPYVRDGVPRSPTELRSPLALIAWGAFCIPFGIVLAVAGIAVAPPSPPPVAIVLPLVLGVAVAALGCWGIHVGRRRARWRRELARWQERHPGQ